MLQKEIEIQKGTYVEKTSNIDINIKNKGFIPENYIEADEKLSVYKRFIMLNKKEDLEELLGEVKDRFGKFPREFEDFVNYMRVKIFAQNNDIIKVKQKGNIFELESTKNISQEVINMLLLKNEQINNKIFRVNREIFLKKIT